MWYRYPVLILLALVALGHPAADAQAVTAGHLKPDGQAPAPVSSIAPDAPVITIDGICSKVPWSVAPPAAISKASEGCKTVITRAEFEKLASVISPNQFPKANPQFANFYSEQLFLAEKAHELGLDQDPHFDDILKFTYLQVLARALNNRLQEQASAMTVAEFEEYYKKHPEEFEQVMLLQISIPKQKQRTESGSSSTSKEQTAVDEAALRAEAESVLTRAVAGEDFEKLEEEAYAVAGDPDSAPLTDMGELTRTDAGQFQKEIFVLQPGQVSKLISGDEAWHIFKVVSRQMMARDEAKHHVVEKRMQESVDSLKSSMKLELNSSYFRTDDIPSKLSHETK